MRYDVGIRREAWTVGVAVVSRIVRCNGLGETYVVRADGIAWELLPSTNSTFTALHQVLADCPRENLAGTSRDIHATRKYASSSAHAAALRIHTGPDSLPRQLRPSPPPPHLLRIFTLRTHGLVRLKFQGRLWCQEDRRRRIRVPVPLKPETMLCGTRRLF